MKDFKKYTITNNEDTKWIVITDKNIEKDSKWLGFRELLKTEDLPQRVTQDIIRNYPTYIIVDNQNETYARDLYHWVISQDIALCVQYTKTYIIKKGKEKKFENAMNECGAGYNNTGDSQVFLNKPISWSYTSWPITSRKIQSSRRNHMIKSSKLQFDSHMNKNDIHNFIRRWNYAVSEEKLKDIASVEYDPNSYETVDGAYIITYKDGSVETAGWADDIRGFRWLNTKHNHGPIESSRRNKMIKSSMSEMQEWNTLSDDEKKRRDEPYNKAADEWIAKQNQLERERKRKSKEVLDYWRKQGLTSRFNQMDREVNNMIKSAYTREDYDRFDEVGNFIPYNPTEEELAKKDEIKTVLRQELSDAYEPDPMDDYVGYDSTNERIDMACERVAKQFGVDTDFVEEIAGEIDRENIARANAEPEYVYQHCKDKDRFWDWYNGEDVSLEELGIDKEQMDREVDEMVHKYVNSSRQIKSSNEDSKLYTVEDFVDLISADWQTKEDFIDWVKDGTHGSDKLSTSRWMEIWRDYDAESKIAPESEEQTELNISVGEFGQDGEITVRKREDGKWHGSDGKTFMGYLKPDDILHWYRQDYGSAWIDSSRQVKSALDTVKVTFDNGDTIVTDYNADVGREEIAKYYMHNYFNVGGEDEMHQVVKVEFPGNINSARVPEKADLDTGEEMNVSTFRLNSSRQIKSALTQKQKNYVLNYIKENSFFPCDNGKYFYFIVPTDDKHIKMTPGFKKQLKDEGLYGDSFIGGMTDEAKLPIDMMWLPIYGDTDRWVTKWFTYSYNSCFDRDLRDRGRGLSKRLDLNNINSSKKPIKSSIITPWDTNQVTGTSDEDLGLSAVVDIYGNEFVNVDESTLNELKDTLVRYFDDEAYVRDWNINNPDYQIEDAFEVTDPEEMDVKDLARYFDYEAYGRDIRLEDNMVWDSENQYWISAHDVDDEE